MTDPKTLSRRAALGALAASVASAGLGGVRPSLAQSATAAQPVAGMCVLTPQAVEGPFYFDPALERSDITEGLPGVPLELALAVIDAATCAPLKGARVDVWHADAIGRYSGYEGQADGHDVSTRGETFLRGAQATDEAGVVRFRTIYPGWYRGRTAHIHLKVLLDGSSVLTTQLYFPDALSEYIYANVPAYAARTAPRDTVNATDGVLAHTTNPRSTFAAIREDADRYVATLTIAADRNGAASAARMEGSPPPPPGGRRGPPPGGGPRGEGPPPEEGPPPDMRRRPKGPLTPGG